MIILTSKKPCSKCGSYERTIKRECVQCKKLRDKQYREANPEKIKARKHEYHIKNREKILAEHRAYYEANKEHHLEVSRLWKQNNPIKRYIANMKWGKNPEHRAKDNEYHREWRKNNPDKAREQGRKWRRENPEKAIARCHARRARIKGSGGTYTKREWEGLLDLYGHKCLCCGRSDVKLTVDHVIPISMGGSNTIDNIQPLCFTCNDRKNAKVIDYRPKRSP